MKNDKRAATLDELFKYFCEAEFPMHIQKGSLLEVSLKKAYYTGFIEAFDKYDAALTPEEREFYSSHFRSLMSELMEYWNAEN